MEMRHAYHLESIVNDDGTVHLPKSLQKHKVKLVVYDLEQIRQNPLEYFKTIAQNYSAITDEPDLDIDEIYREREQIHEQLTKNTTQPFRSFFH